MIIYVAPWWVSSSFNSPFSSNIPTVLIDSKQLKIRPLTIESVTNLHVYLSYISCIGKIKKMYSKLVMYAIA